MYVTYESADKTFAPSDTPERKMYSDRVAYVSDLAKAAGEVFGVLSGGFDSNGLPFGLLLPGVQVPTYKHIVKWQETLSIAKRVAEQLKQNNVKEVVFWYNKREMTEAARPIHRYQAIMLEACDAAGVAYSAIPIEEKLGGEIKEPAQIEPGIWHDVDPLTGKPKHAPTKYPPKGVSMNKKAEQTFLLRAQDEKGLWYHVRKSTFLPDLQIKAKMLVKKFPNQKVLIIAEQKDEQFPI